MATSISHTATGDTRPWWRRFFAFALRCWKNFSEEDTSLRCAGTAFFGFLSIFPAIATVVLIFGLFADRAALGKTLDAVRYVLPTQILDVVREQLTLLIAQPAATLGFGLVFTVALALWSGSRGVNALIYAMSRVRHEPERRNFIKAALVSIGLSVAGAIFLVLALVIIAGLPALFPWPTREEWLLLVIRWPFLLLLTIIALMALYRWGPDRHPRRFSFIWPGAVFASLLWIVVGAIFSIYVENFSNYQASFGSVTAAIVLLLWLYNSAQIFVLGAVLNAELELGSHQHRDVPKLSKEK
ncbi:MAG: YihY/virulence factor BrkB family protein [Devosia sp.]